MRKNLTRDRAENLSNICQDEDWGILENYRKSAEVDGVEASGSSQTRKYARSSVLSAFN